MIDEIDLKEKEELRKRAQAFQDSQEGSFEGDIEALLDEIEKIEDLYVED